eukprot:TRINITY_DN68863_c0_g1_i1.p1 TRINITY_DN68863_c0_g1~~TRINITY_DN68863_c0_g1_i1.p1  ORF type:complete len:376 (+),score=68.27 TRINITY_DN68863_c0_g1_i1:84-1211(+)
MSDQAPVDPPEALKRLDATNIDADKWPDSHVMHGHPDCNPWAMLTNPAAVPTLNAGDVLFEFVCKSGDRMNENEYDLLGVNANISSFKDEVKENGVPFIDVSNPQSLSAYTVVLVKTIYTIPGVEATDPRLSPDFLATAEYHRRCQPANTRIWDDVPDSKRHNTFRMTKAIIPYVYSMTIQLQVSEITDPKTLAEVGRLDGAPPTRLFLFERTKRHIHRKDSTVKCKSVVSIYPAKGGVIFSHVTIALNSSIPRVVAPLVSRLGQFGCREASETCARSRVYYGEKFLGRTAAATMVSEIGGCARASGLLSPATGSASEDGGSVCADCVREHAEGNGSCAVHAAEESPAQWTPTSEDPSRAETAEPKATSRRGSAA